MDHGLVDRACLDGMFVGHLEGIVGKLVKGIARLLRVARWGPDLLIADIYFCVKTGEFDIDPIGIFGYGIEEAAIADNVGIDGVRKAERIARAVENLVFVRREIDPEISATFWRVGAITGYKTAKYQQNSERSGHCVGFKILRV